MLVLSCGVKVAAADREAGSTGQGLVVSFIIRNMGSILAGMANCFQAIDDRALPVREL